MTLDAEEVGREGIGEKPDVPRDGMRTCGTASATPACSGVRRVAVPAFWVFITVSTGVARAAAGLALWRPEAGLTPAPTSLSLAAVPGLVATGVA